VTVVGSFEFPGCRYGGHDGERKGNRGSSRQVADLRQWTVKSTEWRFEEVFGGGKGEDFGQAKFASLI
jgi:hypothetical protein